MKLNCPHFSVCSGCEIKERLESPPLWQEAADFFESLNLQKPVFEVGQIHHWRNRAKLAVRGEAFNPIIGLYEKGSHRAIKIPECRVHHLLINQAVLVLEKALIQTGLSPYDEKTGLGILRYVQFVVERSSRKVQVALVLNLHESNYPSIYPFLDILWELLGNLRHSIWLNSHIKMSNTIFSNWWKHYRGDLTLFEKHADITMGYHPGSFGQANPEMYERLLIDIKNEILPKKAVLELYAGTGTIGFTVREVSQDVLLGEINPASEAGFLEALSLNLSPTPIKWTFGGAGQLLELLKQREVLIVDPPRKGIDEGLLKAINGPLGKDLKQIIYVSCNFLSFKPQATFLIEQGWKLKIAKGYLFFPGTSHIETLAVFNKL